MNIFEFERKLKKLNPRLTIGKNFTDSVNPELLSCGIYLKDSYTGRDLSDNDINVLSGELYKNAKSVQNNPDEYITWATVKHVPRLTEFAAQKNKYNNEGDIIANGYYDILRLLVGKKLINPEQASELFNVGFFGYSEWDNLSFAQKRVKNAKFYPWMDTIGDSEQSS